MAHDVFISHAAKDKAAADLVYATLEAAGVRCWIASRDVPPDADRLAAIAEAISASRVIVAVVSPSNGSASDEIDLAAKIGLPVVPVRSDAVKSAGRSNAPLDNLVKTVVRLLEEDVAPPDSIAPSVLRPVPTAKADMIVRALRGYAQRPGLVVAAVCAVGVLFLAWQLETDESGQDLASAPSSVMDHSSPDAMDRTIANPRSHGKAHVCLEDYPAESVRLGEQGTTTLGFTIRDDGTTGDIRVLKSSGSPRLDAAAMRCASSWQYKPAIKDGTAVAVPWKAEVKWVLH